MLLVEITVAIAEFDFQCLEETSPIASKTRKKLQKQEICTLHDLDGL